MYVMRHASIDDAAVVRELLERCLLFDSRPALSEFKELRVPVANSVRTLVAEDDSGAIVALGVAAWHPIEVGEDDGYWAAEIAIDPMERSPEGYGDVLGRLAADLGGMPSFWAFDEVQAQAALLSELAEVRAIVEMARPLPAPIGGFDESYGVRAFRVGVDEGHWLLLNKQVFDHHPEAGAIDGADLALRMSQPWFDPAGLLILYQGDEAIGYCWTKMHDHATGEIYMIGLIPEHRGKGLARPLTQAGLDHLAASGADRAILYAEAANEAAIGLYATMGFEVERRLALYAPGPT